MNCETCTGPVSPHFSKNSAGMCEHCATILEARDRKEARGRAKLEVISSLLGAVVWSGLGGFVYWQVLNGGQLMLPSALAVPLVFLEAMAGVTGVAILFTGITIAILGYAAFAYKNMIRLS